MEVKAITKSLICLMLLLSCGCVSNVEYRSHGIDNLRYIERSPSKYVGELYAFQGEVIQAQESGSKIVFQMLTKNYYSSYEYGPSLTILFSQTNTPIIKNSWVKVLGRIGYPVEGQNAFGMPVSSLTMNAIAVSVDGHVYYSTKDEAIVEQWQSGELFAPKKAEKPIDGATLKTKKKKVIKNEVIGKWFDRNPYNGGRITIFGENGKLFKEKKYSDNSVGKREMVEMESPKGRAFKKKGGRFIDEFYLINSQGNLQLWDEEGIVWTAKKIE